MLVLFTNLVFPAVSEPQVHRIETKTAPKPSQPELILSDGKFLNLMVFLFLTISEKKLYMFLKHTPEMKLADPLVKSFSLVS